MYFQGSKSKNRPPEPENGIWGPKSVWSCDISIDRKGEKKPSEPKNGIRGQNQYNRVTYPSIGHFTGSKKIYTFGGQKGENKASDPKNGT
jgi:hypothetical protein